MESVEQFLRMEKEEHLNSCVYQDFQYWNYCRFSVFNLADREKSGISPAFVLQKRGLLFQLKRIGKVLTNPVYNLRRVRKTDIMVLNHSRRIQNGEFFECVYTDELLKGMDASAYQVFEGSYQQEHRIPVETKNLFYLDRIELGNSLKYYFYRLFTPAQYHRDKENTGKLATNLASLLEQYMEVSVDKEKLARILLENYWSYRFTKKALRKLFEKIAPKVVVECVSYANPSVMIINEIAKEKNVMTLELQHGSMGKNHVGYNYLTENIRQFPNRVLTYSAYWNHITRLPIPAEDVIACGYPYFERSHSQYASQVQKEKIILFISQPVFGNKLSSFAISLQSQIGKEWKIIYKMHPAEYIDWRTRYPELTQADIEVVDHNKKSLYEYYAKSMIQVGVYSTAIYEGIGFDLKTFVVDLYRAEDMDELCKAGYAVKVKTPEEISRYLNNLSGVEEIAEENDLWYKNAAENILREIKRAEKDTTENKS